MLRLGYSSWNCGWHGTAVVYHGGAYYGNAAWHGGYYGGYHASGPYGGASTYHGAYGSAASYHGYGANGTYHTGSAYNTAWGSGASHTTYAPNGCGPQKLRAAGFGPVTLLQCDGRKSGFLFPDLGIALIAKGFRPCGILGNDRGWLAYWKKPSDSSAFLADSRKRRDALFNPEAYPSVAAVQ